MNAKDSKDLSHRCYKFRKRRVSYRVYILWFSCSQQLLNYLAIQYLDFESAKWRLFAACAPYHISRFTLACW